MSHEETPIEPELRSETKLSMFSDQFGISGAQELRSLEAAKKVAELALKHDPASEELKLDQEIADLEVQLFRNEHDNAGAFKFNRFGRESRDLFEVGGNRGLHLDDDGKIVCEKGQRNHRMLMVNMGELDRFNKAGGHAVGDEVLKNTAHAIEMAVLKVLGTKSYRMYRADSNEFMVDFEDIDETVFERVQDEIAKARPVATGVTEAAPLTISSATMEEVVDMINVVQKAAGVPPFTGDDEGARADQANRAVVDMVRNYTFFQLEMGKFETRAGRLRSKLESGDANDAKAFFDNFGGDLQGTRLGSIEGIKELMAEGDAAWEAEVQRLGFEHAHKRFELEQQEADARDATIKAAIKQRQKTEPVFNDRTDADEDALPLAVIPKSSSGQREVARLKAEYEALPEGKVSIERKRKTAALRRYESEDSSRDRGTGLNTRGTYFKNLENSLEKKGGTVLFIDMAFLKYFDKHGGREVGNAAVKVAADVLERTLTETGLAGEVYRLAGDEFTVRLDGTTKDARTFVETMKALRDQAGRIPSTKGSDITYAPEKLSFNYGVCDRELMEGVFNDLVTAGGVPAEILADEKRLANYKAELFTVIADKSIEEEKAIDRFQLLTAKMRTDKYKTDEVHRGQVEALIMRSKKAIFTDFKGDEELRRIAEDQEKYPEGSKALEEEIRRVVAEKMADAKQIENAKVELRGQLIELHIHIKRLEEEKSQLTGENAELQARIDTLESERSKLLNVRDEIQAA